MNITDLRELYLSEQQEARSMEEQIGEALPRLAGAASDADLERMLCDDVSEVRSQVERLTSIIEGHGAKLRAQKDRSMQTILAEAEKWAGVIEDPALRDVALIASARRIQHYEIAVYGSLAAGTKQLGLDETAALHAILDEEEAAAAKLTDLAERSIHLAAAA